MLEKIIRPHFLDLQAYVPAEQIPGAVKLNANELPWDVSGCGYNRYPLHRPQALMQCLSDYYQTEASQLLVTRGGNEAIDLLIRLSCTPGADAIITCPPTFKMYAQYAQFNQVEHTEIPLLVEQKFSLPIQNIVAQSNDQHKLIFICSPNNPTANTIKTQEILAVAQQFQQRALVVVDEAYIEFSDVASLAQYVNEYPNLVVIRTLSKALGLAAVRAGIIIAHTELANYLQRLIPPYAIPAPVSDAVIQQLSPEKLQRLQEYHGILRQQRQRLLLALQHSSQVEMVFPSSANFILAKFYCVDDFFKRCQQQQLLLRDMRQYAGLNHCLRISVGNEQQNDQLIELL